MMSLEDFLATLPTEQQRSILERAHQLLLEMIAKLDTPINGHNKHEVSG